MASKDRDAVHEGLSNILSDDFVSQVVRGDRERAGRGATSRSAPKDAAPPTDLPTGSTTTNTTSSKVGSATGAEAGEAAAAPERANPLDGALRAMLAQPYAGDPRKGPFTVTSMKLQTEIAERLGYAAALTKQPKQEIVSEALRLYFERLLDA